MSIKEWEDKTFYSRYGELEHGHLFWTCVLLLWIPLMLFLSVASIISGITEGKIDSPLMFVTAILISCLLTFVFSFTVGIVDYFIVGTILKNSEVRPLKCITMVSVIGLIIGLDIFLK